MDFESAHPIDQKLGVVRTLQQRTEVVTSEKEDLRTELKHVNKALGVCKYPRWAIRKVAKNLNKKKDKTGKATSKKRDSKGSIVLSYIKGKTETLKRVFGKQKVF